MSTAGPAIASTSPPVAAALDLAAKSIHVGPVCVVVDGACADGWGHARHDIGKAPLTPNGVDDFTTDERTIRAMWARHPNAGVAIDLERSGLVDIAPDSPKWHADFKRRGIPGTAARFDSGGGEGHEHFIMARPDDCPTHRICKSGEYDILSKGYSVVPPSMHHSGRKREWTVPIVELGFLPEAPRWAVDMLRAAAERTARSPNGADGSEPPVRLTGRGLAWWTGEEVARLESGSVDRSLTLWRIGMFLKQAGATRRTIVEALGERDVSLGYEKYAHRRDGGGPDYGDIADKLLSEPSLDATGLGQDWDKPIPLVNADALPGFPVEVFPDWLRNFVEAEAIATQTPFDLASMTVLSALATGAAKRIVVEPKPGWREPVNIWTVTALDPGNRKSAVFSDVTRPIVAFEQAEAERLAKDIAETRVRLAIMQKELSRAQDAAAKAKDINDHEGFARTAIDLQRKIDATRVPVAPRLVADDTTPEKLAALMGEHGGRMSVLSAEAEIFEQMAGKYQSGTQSFNVFLKGHSGDDLRVDRVGRSPDHVLSPALTLGLTVQPAVIQGLAERPGFRGRGLLARICYSLPTSTVGSRDVDPPPVPEHVRQAYAEHLTAILNLRAEDDEPHVVVLTPEAVERLHDMAQLLEPSLAPHAQFGFMADWAAKLTGTAVRIAALLHVADCIGGDCEPWSRPIGEHVIDRARDVASYLLTHAMAAIRTMGADPATSDAEYLLGWLRHDRVASFTVRDAQRHAQSRFRRAAQLESPLQLLVDRGYIRPRIGAEPGTGRPAGTVYEVNPRVLVEAA